MQRKTLILVSASLVVVVCLASVASYSLYLTNQRNRRLAEISTLSERVQSFVAQYDRAQYRVTEEQLTVDATIHNCWVVIWYNPSGDLLDHTVKVWIDKESLVILDVQEIW